LLSRGTKQAMKPSMEHHDFGEVYQALKEMVWRLSSRYTVGKEDREDLFQEIFLNIHKSLNSFRGDAELSTWGYRVAVNTAMKWLGKVTRQRKLKNLFLGFRTIDEVNTAEEIAHNTSRGMERVLAKLNPKQRMILVLSDVEEKTLDEIAVSLGMPVGTVKSNLFRAREIVKKELKDNE